jgi:hypothetical protein
LNFKNQQVFGAVDLSEEFTILEKIFEGVSLIGDCKNQNQILSKGNCTAKYGSDPCGNHLVYRCSMN